GRCINRSEPQVHAEWCNQRQAQEAVGNCAACGTFLARAIRVNMDPLSISSACRELVDHGLVDGDPMGPAEILADEIPDRRECDLCHRCIRCFDHRVLVIPPCREESYDDLVE